jgi:peptidoglycan/LPS O-acetylase OafA/YrhL
VRDRLLRLGLPFVAAAALVAPLAYYPTYLQMATHGNFAGFWRQWFSLGGWPAGPAWFVWLLLAFGCVAALLSLAMPKWGERLGRFTSAASGRPAVFFALLCAVSAAVYLPMVLAFNPLQWTAFGPFTFQTSRVLHYLAYFLIGAGVGAAGIGRDLLAPDGKLARRWPLWALAALGAFGLVVVITVVTVASHIGSQLWIAIGGFGFVLSCAASSFAMLAIFLRYARSRVKFLDSLRDNAYAIYLVHYAFVSWLQYALLPSSLSAPAKGAIVFLGALALSWCTAILLRRAPAIARVI